MTLMLKKDEHQQLLQIDVRDNDWCERRRALTLLLLYKGLSIDGALAQ